MCWSAACLHEPVAANDVVRRPQPQNRRAVERADCQLTTSPSPTTTRSPRGGLPRDSYEGRTAEFGRYRLGVCGAGGRRTAACRLTRRPRSSRGPEEHPRRCSSSGSRQPILSPLMTYPMWKSANYRSGLYAPPSPDRGSHRPRHASTRRESADRFHPCSTQVSSPSPGRCPAGLAVVHRDHARTTHRARSEHRTNYGKSPTTTQRSTSPMSLTTDRHPTRGLR